MIDQQKIVDLFYQKTGYRFKNINHLTEALTHSSAKDTDKCCNERLEFLGDAVLGHIISEYLYKSFPDYEEGKLSVIKSVIVSAKYLAKAAKNLGLNNIIITGKGIGERPPSSILSDAFEAVVAAIYMDSGLDHAAKFVHDYLIKDNVNAIVTEQYEMNYKSLLQDYTQKNGWNLPLYKVTKELGPDHKKRFQVVAEVNSQLFGSTWGNSKKEAEQKAARLALYQLGLLKENQDNQF